MTAPPRLWSEEELAFVRAAHDAGTPWSEIGDRFGLSAGAARKRYARAVSAGVAAVTEAGAGIEGVQAGEPPDVGRLWADRARAWREQELRADRKAQQAVYLPGRVACLVFLADLHLGNAGVNYPRLRRELDLITSMPGTFVWTMGDIVDSFIGSWVASIRYETTMRVRDEWHLATDVMRQLRPQLVASVGGNHDVDWLLKQAGVDIYEMILSGEAPKALYDTDDCRADVHVGDLSLRVRARHKWRGHSIYNPTHGQERAARWDNDADVYVGAHTHIGCFIRSFTVGGERKYAVLCGPYKQHDPYARREGFSMSHASTAASLILYEDGRVLGVEDLATAHRIMTLEARQGGVGPVD